MARLNSIMMAGAVSTALLGGGLFAATAGTASAAAPSATPAAASTCGALFDDFAYSSPSDSSFTSNGWSARSNAGGPGLPGATWSANNISFPTVDGQKVAQLQASTDGTAAGTSQAEFLQTRQRFQNGTYASRIKFQDAPTTGTDGDHINETFFAIGPAQRFDYDPLYSELDFSEYLPNGGWGATGPINYQTSYNGYREDPWDPHNKHSQETASFAGWHTLVSTVADGHVKYYIDGTLEGDHTVDEQTGTYPVAPRVPMSVNYNLWLIDTAGHTSGTSTYTEDVDWFYYAKDQVLTPAAAAAAATTYRSAGTTHTDNLDTSTCPTSPTPTPTPTATTPTPTPTTPTPTPTTTTPAPPANCSAATEWNWSTVYLAGQRVKHNNHLWEANWWTQGSEPGPTAQWKDLGAC
jgi:hypothetical protein